MSASAEHLRAIGPAGQPVGEWCPSCHQHVTAITWNGKCCWCDTRIHETAATRHERFKAQMKALRGRSSVLNWLAANGPSDCQQISDGTGFARRTVYAVVCEFERDGTIVVVEKRATGGYPKKIVALADATRSRAATFARDTEWRDA